jgi:tetratricopeptide (TPR) repeat protein
MQPPSQLPPPPVATRPSSLPCRLLHWEAFQNLCVELARLVDSVTDAREYGEPGQQQGGIDVYARLPDGKTVVYQARNIKTLTANKLRKAVEDFLNDDKPLSPSRFVLCVACSGRNTKILKELEALRNENPHLEIDLYDDQRISEKLQLASHLVDRYFGPPWRDLFCGTLTTPSAAPRNKLSADSLLRGPLQSLGLQEQLDEADRLSSDDPRSAAEIYEGVERALERGGFAGHAAALQIRRAELLKSSGRTEAAFEVVFDQAVHQFESGDLLTIGLTLHRLEDLSTDMPDAYKVRVQALNGHLRWYEAPDRDYTILEYACNALRDIDDAFTSTVFVWLGEAALADHSASTLRRLQPVFEKLLQDGPPETVRIRLQLLVAESTKNWSELVRVAGTGRLSPQMATLVQLRYGRWLAWEAEPEGAEDAYRRAVLPATEAGLDGDAKEALFAMQELQLRYGSAQLPQLQETLDRGRVARSIPGNERQFSGQSDSFRVALTSLHEGRFPDAHRAMRRFLWESVVGGHLRSELQAHELLGRLYADSGEHEAGLRHLVWAGAYEQVGKILVTADALNSLWGEASKQVPWVLVALLSAVEARGDLMSSEEVEQELTDLVSLTNGVLQSPLGPQVRDHAFKALASVSLQIASTHADRLLSLLEPIAANPSDFSISTRESAILSVLALYAGNAEYRPRSGPIWIRFLSDPLNAQDAARTLISAAGLLGEEMRVLLRARAHDQDGWAAIVLAHLHDQSPVVIREAERRIAQTLAVQIDPASTSRSIGRWDPESALFALHLAEEPRVELARHLMSLAEQITDLETNRAGALSGITILASTLPQEVRHELFTRVVPLADPQVEVSRMDQLQRAMSHRLSRIRINLGQGSLPPAALILLGALATSREQADQVEALVGNALRSPISELQHAAALALEQLDPTLRSYPVRWLAAHPSELVQSVAVKLWAQDPHRRTELAEFFFTSASRQVRIRLADHIQIISQSDPELAELIRVRLQQDNSAQVRWHVATYGSDARLDG